MAKASHIVRRRFVVNRVSANTMEPRGCIGHYDEKEDRYTLYVGLQNPHEVRRQLASDIFSLPETSFRIVPGDIGGSFGMRGGTYPEYTLAPWASRKVGRPVKWISERSEGLASDDHARDNGMSCFQSNMVPYLPALVRPFSSRSGRHQQGNNHICAQCRAVIR